MKGFRIFVWALLLPLSAFAHHAHKNRQGLDDVTVLLVRHAEKPTLGNDLSEQGLRRAEAYARYFDPLRLPDASLLPQRLIATADSKSSERPRLTLTPLSRELHLPIEQDWNDRQTAELVKSLRKDNQASVILIAWHHGQIEHLLHKLGADPQQLLGSKKWPEPVYNWIVVLHFDHHGELIPAQSYKVQEHLLRDD